ncbi:MAG TPA: hypothetical protein PKE51_14005, partial [Gemmatimonadaceae bacterium]|nr:hypothetical protein [Gemmatimonadaceae bacterium]
ALEAARLEPYRQPFVDQLMLGVERALGSSLRAELLYVRRTNRNVLTLVDERRERNWSPLANVRVSDAAGPVRDVDGNPIVLPTLWVRNDDLVERLRAGDVVPGYVPSDTLRLWYDADFTLQANDDARRHFDQVQLVLSGRWSRADVTAALAWTRLTGNFFAVSGYLDPTGNGNGPWVDPNTAINADGRLDGFSPWDFKVRASGMLPLGLEGGAFLAVRTGDFWTPTLPIRRTLDYAIETGGGVVPLDDAIVRFATGQSLQLEPRGARQLDLLATLDLRLQRALAVAGRSVVFGVEVFNVLGGNAVTARSTSVLDEVGAVRARQAPRTIRVSAQLR